MFFALNALQTLGAFAAGVALGLICVFIFFSVRPKRANDGKKDENDQEKKEEQGCGEVEKARDSVYTHHL